LDKNRKISPIAPILLIKRSRLPIDTAISDPRGTNQERNNEIETAETGITADRRLWEMGYCNLRASIIDCWVLVEIRSLGE
jgi:hypothetical protein